MKKILGTILGPRLRAARRAKALTAIACAKEVGVSQPAWNMWEMGVRLPKIELLTEICDLLQISPNHLLGYDDPPSALSAPPREPKPSISTGDGSPVVNGVTAGRDVIVTVGAKPARRRRKAPVKSDLKKNRPLSARDPGAPGDPGAGAYNPLTAVIQ